VVLAKEFDTQPQTKSLLLLKFTNKLWGSGDEVNFTRLGDENPSSLEIFG